MPPELNAAREVFAYLATGDPFPAASVDAVVGFGMFDLRLPVFCGDIYARGHARRIVFTGGIGAGTGNLGRPEADAWRDELFRHHPAVPRDHLIIENRSTQTAENIAFTAALLQREHPDLAFGSGLRTALIVASPSRLRRVKLTLQYLQPTLQAIRTLPPSTSFESERDLYHRQGIDYVDHLAGELDRIVSYASKGWIAAEPLPPAIAAAHTALRSYRKGNIMNR